MTDEPSSTCESPSDDRLDIGRLRMAAWAIEMLLQDVLVSIAFGVQIGVERHRSLQLSDVGGLAVGVFGMALFVPIFGFLMSGYVLTSLTARFFVPTRRWWLYPLVLAGLASFHFGIIFLRDEHRSFDGALVALWIAITLIAFGSGVVGSRYLRRRIG